MDSDQNCVAQAHLSCKSLCGSGRMVVRGGVGTGDCVCKALKREVRWQHDQSCAIAGSEFTFDRKALLVSLQHISKQEFPVCQHLKGKPLSSGLKSSRPSNLSVSARPASQS